ncbi:RNA polymerase Rpb5, C-terminal domain-containing protein [Blastocladiella britannica]|nr:RNA polymerase Rpb5, C-terminal domain-containing protein [Blastocladiella britannica]
MSDAATLSEISRMHRIHRTIYEMMKERGYIVTDAQLNQTLDEFKEHHAPSNTLVRGDSLNLLFIKSGDTEEEQQQTLVSFLEAKGDKAKIGKPEVVEFSTKMVSNRIPRGIAVLRNPLSSQAAKAVQAMAEKDCMIESFDEAELIVNITKHVLVPKHEVLDSEAKKTLLDRYRLKETQLPRIPQADPVARFYGMRRGQVAKIIRTSETAGRYVTYRLCY